MKTIGLLGGITCESSLVYYKLVNEMTRARLGGHHAARSVMVSVDFADIQPLTERGAWTGVPKAFADNGFTEVARRSPARPIMRFDFHYRAGR